MADQIAATIESVNKALSKEVDANPDELARRLHEAGAAS